MPYHHGYDYSGENAVATLVLVVLIILAVLLAISLFLLVRCVALIVRVFAKDGKNRALWISLSVGLALGLPGLLLALSVNPDFIVLAGLGLLQFLITCKAVEIGNTQLFLREKNDLVDQIIHPKSWWADYNA